jgi:hypothetical protein
MDRLHFRLINDRVRQLVIRAVNEAPDGYHVEIKPRTRSLEQNALLWSLLADVSRQVDWHGQKLSSEDWKILFSASLKAQTVCPGIDGGFVALGQSTSKMSVKELSDLCEIIFAFGAERDVKWSQS